MTLYICLYVSLSAILPVSMNVYLSICLSISLSVCLSLRLSPVATKSPHSIFLFSPSIFLCFSATNFFVVFLLCAFQVLFETSKTKERKRSMVKMKRERKAAWRPDELRGKCMRSSFSQLHSNHHKKTPRKKDSDDSATFLSFMLTEKWKRKTLKKLEKGKKQKKNTKLMKKVYDLDFSLTWPMIPISAVAWKSPLVTKKGKKENTTNQIEIIRPISSDSSISSLID